MDHASDHVIVIVDHRPSFLARSGRSLLTLPLGRTSLLDYLVGELAQELGECAVTIAPTFHAEQGYAADVQHRCPGARVLELASLHEMLFDLEPSDWVLFVDPADIPIQGIRAAGLPETVRKARLATHIIALATDAGHAEEHVIFDDRQRVRTIQRYYGGITNVQACGVFASYVPVSSLRILNGSFGVVPRHLRGELAMHGIPNNDITVGGGTLDLRETEQMLLLNNLLLEGSREGASQKDAETQRKDDIHCGDGVQIDETARIYGPAVIGDGTTIGARAVIVGPVVIGKESRIGEGALVAGAILDDFARIGDGEIVCDRIIAGEAEESCKRQPATRPTTDADQRAKHRDARGNGAGSRLPDKGKPRARQIEARLKSGMDIATAAIGLVMLSPVFAVVAALVKLTSRGPVLFGHMREGKGGKEFRCLKFRTMCEDAHAKQRKLYQQSEVDGPQFKISKDPRITWLGRVLRVTNIDELPQLINVMRGEMSLVGPRPSPFRENQICVPWRRARLSVRPGITGLWQVCRHDRSAGDFHQWIHYDMLYVENWSVLLDVKILLSTLLTLSGRFGMPVTWLIRPKTKRLPTPVTGADLGAVPQTANAEEWDSICEMVGETYGVEAGGTDGTRLSGDLEAAREAAWWSKPDAVGNAAQPASR